MFFNFEVGEPHENPSSPTIFSPRPISLGNLEQSARNSGFDRMESIETLYGGSEGRSLKSETINADESGSSEKPLGGARFMHKVKRSLQGWHADSLG